MRACKCFSRGQPIIKELEILYDAVRTLGSKGELKITQWIRGSGLAWTNAYNKSCMSYGNSRGHSEKWWRLFIKKCHVLGVVKKELKSIIKQSQHYGIQGIISKSSEGEAVIESGASFMVPVNTLHDPISAEHSSLTSRKDCDIQQTVEKKSAKKTMRAGKGSHGLAIIKKLVEEEENWEMITTKSDYQFPGVYTSSAFQRAFYTPNCRDLPQSSDNVNFLWDDVQLSKSGWNKDREVEFTISGRKEKLMYRVASCNGVRLCPIDSCDYACGTNISSETM